MRLLTALFSGAAGLCAMVAATPVAEAQSVFQKLLGLGGESASQPMPQQAMRPINPAPARLLGSTRWRSYSSYGGRRNASSGEPDTRGPYKTMCVRTCDGFYFPVRQNARRRNFDTDVKSCRNACGDDAKLFYYPANGSQGPESMVDLAGRKYSDHPKAFAYRKTLVAGCTCKPAPWSYQESTRHQSYADQEASELEKDKAFLQARAAAAAKAAGGAAADAESRTEPSSIVETQQATTVAPEASEVILAAAWSVSGHVHLDGASAIKADFSQSKVTTALAEAGPFEPELDPLRTRLEPVAPPRAIRPRPKFGDQRPAFRVVSNSSFGRPPAKPSAGFFNIFAGTGPNSILGE
jgi:hypothetical protein